MAVVSATVNQFTVKAYPGDNKTLLSFDFADETPAKNLAGFTIACKLPGTQPAFYLFNFLRFETPQDHAQVKAELPTSTVNAPIQKYRWVDFAHAPSTGGDLVAGNYTYTVTPRYFDGSGKMLAMDSTKSVSVTVPVGPFTSGALKLGFTRGYMQSQAYVRHFGADTPVEPDKRTLQYDTSAKAGTNKAGKDVTFAQIYEWMGTTARARIFDVLNQVVNDKTLSLDVFAYDLNEPDVVAAFLKLAGEGRIRIILDSAQLHITHQEKNQKTGAMTTVVPLEDEFAKAFTAAAKGKAEIKRGCFARYSHDKVFIVSKDGLASKVLTGATNFSVNGLYVNANHVLVFQEPTIAQHYAQVFEESWTVLTSPNVSKTIASAFAASTLATGAFTNTAPNLPKMTINVSPHTTPDTTKILTAMQKRIVGEASATNGNVLFAVMQLTNTESPVCQTLITLHSTQSLYSYGISDAPGGVTLYAPGNKAGVLVTGQPGQVLLPPPFDRVPTPPGHEIHDKFVVCGLNGADPVVWCGSSNLATGGEECNGDNLLEIHDADVATTFAIEALLLVDHYNFLDRYAAPKKAKAPSAPAASNAAAKKAAAAGSAADAGSPTKASAKTVPAKSTPAKTATTAKAVKKSAAKRMSATNASLRMAAAVARMVAPGKKKPANNTPSKTTGAKLGAANPARSAAKSVAGASTKNVAKGNAGTAAGNALATPPTATNPAGRQLVTKMPQSLEQAATQAGMFLYTNDAWSVRYFDPNDLHFLERKVFG